MSDPELARELNAAVLAVDCVLQTYDTAPPVVAVVAGAAAAVLGTAPVQPITIGRSAEGVTVTARIAVSEQRPAAETCREVYAVLIDRLDLWAAGHPDEPPVASVSVEVSRIG